MMTFFKIKNKPFHFLFVFIFACMTTKPVFANPMESSSSLSKEEVILEDENSLYLEKREGVWRLINCEGSSLCREVKMDDADKIAHQLEDLKSPIENYCRQEKEDYLCDLFAFSLELTQKITNHEAGVGAKIFAGVMISSMAMVIAVNVSGPLGLSFIVIFAVTTVLKHFEEKEDIDEIRKELSKILEENAQNDFGFRHSLR